MEAGTIRIKGIKIRKLSPDKNECQLVWRMVVRNINNTLFWASFRRVSLHRYYVSVALAMLVLLWVLTWSLCVAIVTALSLYAALCYVVVWRGRRKWENLFLEEKRSLYEYYNRDKTGFWVADYNGRVVGSVAVDRLRDNVAELRRMAVEPEFRRLGIAQVLMTTAIGFCKDNDYREVVLTTSEFQTDAQKFYKRNGFQETGIIFYRSIYPMVSYKRRNFSLNLSKY